MTAQPVPTFAVVPGDQVRAALHGHEAEVVDLVCQAYRRHCAGDTVNPPSYFLRFLDRPDSRIIALPASLGGDAPVDGLKWISSFPDNVAAGLPRASGVLILNDPETGHPFACLEASAISAVRTAAMATLAARTLRRDPPRRVGFFGAGPIARYINHYLVETGSCFEQAAVYDLSAERAAAFGGYLDRSGHRGRVVVHHHPEQLVRSSDLVVFATAAGLPHVTDPSWFDHHPLVLHVSLRDLAPQILLASANVVDDVDHCLRADTSPHLAEQLVGHRDFLLGTLDDVATGRARVPARQTTIFSPFGLGVLDLAVGRWVYERVAESGRLDLVDGFFDVTQQPG